MKKSTFFTLSACALASLAMYRLKSNLKKFKNKNGLAQFHQERTTAGMFV